MGKSWMDRDAAKVRLRGPEGEVAKHRLMLDHYERMEAASAHRERVTLGIDLARPGGDTSVWMVAWSPPDPLTELARLQDGERHHWTSPCREELLARFLIEKTFRGDGRWNGDRITLKGLRELKAR